MLLCAAAPADDLAKHCDVHAATMVAEMRASATRTMTADEIKLVRETAFKSCLAQSGAGQPPGDVTAEQMEGAADLADRYSQGELRVTHDQNLLLPWVKAADLYAAMNTPDSDNQMRSRGFVLIDGPHGYPFPEIEYFYFYPRLKPGALLVVDDIRRVRQLRLRRPGSVYLSIQSLCRTPVATGMRTCGVSSVTIQLCQRARV